MVGNKVRARELLWLWSGRIIITATFISVIVVITLLMQGE